MTEIPKGQPPEDERSKSGCLSPILFWAGVIAFFAFAGVIDSFFPRSEKVGETLIVVVVLLGILGVILYGMGSSTVKGTAKNFVTLAKWFVALLVLGCCHRRACKHPAHSNQEYFGGVPMHSLP
jgi:hypothetical protein